MQNGIVSRRAARAATETPADYLEDALMRLGPVTIVGFADASFMVVAGNGGRVHGTSLREAIDAALSMLHCDRPTLGYPGAGDHDLAA